MRQQQSFDGAHGGGANAPRGCKESLSAGAFWPTVTVVRHGPRLAPFGEHGRFEPTAMFVLLAEDAAQAPGLDPLIAVHDGAFVLLPRRRC